jgi:hypothetical protein
LECIVFDDKGYKVCNRASGLPPDHAPILRMFINKAVSSSNLNVPFCTLEPSAPKRRV